MSSRSRGELGEGTWGVRGAGCQEDVVVGIYPAFKESCLIPAPAPSPLSGLFQNYIARFGHGSAKLARQAQSKEKTLQKMMASGLTERVVSDKVGSERVELVPEVRWRRRDLTGKCPLLLLDPVILFPTVWQDSSACHHGAERELQVYKRRGESSCVVGRLGHILQDKRQQVGRVSGSLLNTPANPCGARDFSGIAA